VFTELVLVVPLLIEERGREMVIAAFAASVAIALVVLCEIGNR
jgi:hypothetical protein